jgi:predicted DNA binding CopG/RHH family protein
MKKSKKIPRFESEEQEREFWATHDSADYVDWGKAQRTIFPNLVPSTRSVPIRFPVPLLERLKYLANKRHIPYQSLLKIFLQERVEKELVKEPRPRYQAKRRKP